LAGVDGSVSIEPTQAELDYIGGIERLHDPTAVRVTVSEAGIEITEVMPGSRKILIPAADVVDASVTQAENAPSDESGKQTWWNRLRRSVSRTAKAGQILHSDGRDFTLTIRYRENNTVQSAVFQRQGNPGLLTIQLLARAVASLARLTQPN
jgi:hypothetical protein